MNGRSLRLASEWPNMADMPDSLPPRARAKPPPSKKIKLHGILALMYFQVIRLGVVALGNSSGRPPRQKFNQFQLAGNMNNVMTMKMAGVASPILVFVINSAHPVKKPIVKLKFHFKSLLKLKPCNQFTWCTQKE